MMRREAGMPEELIRAWVEREGANIAEARQRYYALGAYDSFLRGRDLPLEAVVRPDLESFERHLLRNHSASTSNAIMRYVSRFYRWAEREGLAKDISDGLTIRSSSESSVRKPVTAAETMLLLSLAKSPRDHALISLLGLCALRPGVVHKLDQEDIAWHGDRAYAHISPNGYAALTMRASESLDRLLRHQPRSLLEERNPLIASSSNRTKGSRLSHRSIREVVHGLIAKANLPTPAEKLDLRGGALEIAIAEGEPFEVLMGIADRTSRARGRWK